MHLKLMSIVLITITTGTSVIAADRITFYRDGAVVQQETVAAKGLVDVPLAPGLREHTLRIIPAAGTTIVGVEMYKNEPGSSADKELDTLVEQRRRLEDRLQALETREAIFTSAAKSQSGKAPRKTKANPDPLQAIRQGTDFAIAQLEAVYTARRKTTQEIGKIDGRLATVKRNGRSAENWLRITVTPPRGRLTLHYATAERGWKPQYNMHLAGNGSVKMQLSAKITGSMRGHQVHVSLGSLAESGTAEIFPTQSDSAVLAGYHLPITEERYSEGIFNRFTGMITNTSPHYLPAGESGLFRNGVYLGKFRFEGLSSGKSRVISLGT